MCTCYEGCCEYLISPLVRTLLFYSHVCLISLAEPFRTPQIRSVPLRTTQNTSAHLRSTQNHSEPLRTTQNTSDPLRTTQNHSEPLRTIQNTSDPLRTNQNQSEPIRTTQNPSEPLRSTQNHYRNFLGHCSLFIVELKQLGRKRLYVFCDSYRISHIYKPQFIFTNHDEK